MSNNNEETFADDDDKKQTSDPNMSDEEDEDDFRAKIFPQRLMELLSDERNSDCIAWLPHGRAFIIRNRKLFAEKVMPKFFPRKSKYSSFTRKLNRWYVAFLCFFFVSSSSVEVTFMISSHPHSP